jgi:predicted transcriptional regulator
MATSRRGAGALFRGSRRASTDSNRKALGALTAIARHRPKSIHELAGIVGRNYKNVSSDIVLLAQLDLVNLASHTGKGGAQEPTVPYDKIHVTIDLRQPHEAHTE